MGKIILTLSIVSVLSITLPSIGQCVTGPPCPNHIVCGQSPPDGPPAQLFTSALLEGQSGHGPSFDPTVIQPIIRILLNSSYAQPRFGGYSFSTTPVQGLGLDFAAPSCNTNPPPCTPDPQPHNLALAFTDPPVNSFNVYLRRLSYSAPAELSLYTDSGLPVMTEDVAPDASISPFDYNFGNQSNGGHKHPLFLMRRPGRIQWNMRFVSDAWGWSTPYLYTLTTVPGRGLLVPIDMSGIFNADVVDSDASDTPTPFDAAGHSWVLNGNYGATAGLPINGRLDGFQLGGPTGARLGGSSTNALLANGTLNLASSLNLVALGNADQYLSLEFLVGASGTITSSDIVSVTLTYDDTTTATIDIRQNSSGNWAPFRPIDNWQQTTAPLPWTAVGLTGDRTTGFVRGTGSAVDTGAGASFYLFRACSPVNSAKTLNQISFANYSGANRIAIFAVLAIKKGPLEITTTSLPAARENTAYFAALSAVGTPPYSDWQAAGLPSGLAINAMTGAISGTPAGGTAAGSPYAVMVSCHDSINAYDSAWPVENASASLSLTVLPRAGDINGDGLVNQIDVSLFVNVLLGVETNPIFVERCDMDNNSAANGLDARQFVQALLAP